MPTAVQQRGFFGAAELSSPPRPYSPAGAAGCSSRQTGSAFVLCPVRCLREKGKGRGRTGAERRGLGCKRRAETGYAMTGCRLLLGSFKNFNVWLGLLEKSPYKLCSPWRTFLWTASQPPLTVVPPRHFCISPNQCHVFLIPLSESMTWISVRHKGNKSSGKNVKQSVEEEEEEEEEEDIDEEERLDSEDELEDDPNVVKDYKDLNKVVPSFRFDVILKSGLDIARNKVEEAFYNGELRLNGEKLWKKSRSVKVGDTLDLILGEDKETETAVVMRVVLRKASEKNESDKYRVVLRRWRKLKVPKQDVLK